MLEITLRIFVLDSNTIRVMTPFVRSLIFWQSATLLSRLRPEHVGAGADGQTPTSVTEWPSTRTPAGSFQDQGDAGGATPGSDGVPWKGEERARLIFGIAARSDEHIGCWGS